MDVYEIINERIRESLEHGTVPWRCPWKHGEFGIPRNFITAKPYHGINPFMLSITSIAKGYGSPFWVSYKQAASVGGSVRQGEKSHAFVVFYSPFETKEIDPETGKPHSAFVLRYTPMFNTDQCDGLKVPNLTDDLYETKRIDKAQSVIDSMPNRPSIREHLSNRAFYAPAIDAVTVPQISQFQNAEEYYSTLFHELGHSTGHKSRLGREFGVSFADHQYSKEELVAEFCASYLCGTVGIETRTLENSASYIEHWLSILKDKVAKKWLVWGASQGQKAAEYIQGKMETKEEQIAA